MLKIIIAVGLCVGIAQFIMGVAIITEHYLEKKNRKKSIDKSLGVCQDRGSTLKKDCEKMSIAKNARCSKVMQDVNGGKYVKNNKFHNFGSVIEDSIFAQQAEADRRLAKIKLQRKTA